jgi:hypothetical protein
MNDHDRAEGEIPAWPWLGSLGDVYELYPFYGLCVFTLAQSGFLFYNVQCTFFILWWFFLLLPPSARLGRRRTLRRAALKIRPWADCGAEYKQDVLR